MSEPDYKGFAIAIMDGFQEPHGEQLDGCDLQEIACKFGLLRKEPTKVPCGEACQCAEFYDAGDTATCYRINWPRE
jgi:hypothetical protein